MSERRDGHFPERGHSKLFHPRFPRAESSATMRLILALPVLLMVLSMVLEGPAPAQAPQHGLPQKSPEPSNTTWLNGTVTRRTSLNWSLKTRTAQTYHRTAAS